MSRLRMGMIGGGKDAFIGAVHRMAAQLDGHATLVAGCFSSTPEKAIESGRELRIDSARNYPTWQAMLEAERAVPPERRLDFVSVVTPNHTHFEIAAAFAKAGFHVVCDKPMTTTTQEARALREIVAASKTVFAVTYNYSGYPMVKQARAMVREGQLGAIRKVIVHYRQGWLATNLETSEQKQASWRTDPNRAGAGGAISDIGSHAEHLISYITGLHIDSLCADLSTFVVGRRLDDDASLLLRFAPRDGAAAKGIMNVSQIEVGADNDLRISVVGERASLHWRQQMPDDLDLCGLDGPETRLRRGHGNLDQSSRNATRLPPGHPEGFIEAFANVYCNVFAAIRAGAAGIDAGARFDFPSVADGERGVRFIEAAVRSSRNGATWISLNE